MTKERPRFSLLLIGMYALPLIAIAAFYWGAYMSRVTPDRAEKAVYLVLEKKIPRITSETRGR
jgi:hypothetical protein